MSQDAFKQTFGEEVLFGGFRDPRVAPGVRARRGSIFIFTRNTGVILVLQKQDNGKTVNWTPYAGGAISWPVSKSILFSDVQPVDLYTVQAGERIIGANAFVIDDFDAAAPTLSVGISTGAVDDIMTVGENNLKAIDEYEASALESPAAGSIIQATIVPGASTKGTVIVAVKRLIITG